MFRAFESLGLVLEHNKSEVFHFSCARSFVGPAIDLGYAPYMGTTPLRPKPVWRYLGFFFDRKLQFKEHAWFYTTRAFTQVRAMGMLSNSVRGLEPDQKRLLYRSCMVPVITYGFRLWYFKGARIKGLIKAMSQVQHTAARWICGNFRTTSGGGAECLSGLLPMHLTLRRLADRGVTHVPTLAMSHPLRTILGEAMEGCHQAHPLALVNSGPLFFLNQKFITQGLLAVHGRHIQTIRKLRLRYALTVMYYQNLDAVSGRQTRACPRVSMDDVALSSRVCS
jgi:hypothetical protein